MASTIVTPDIDMFHLNTQKGNYKLLTTKPNTSASTNRNWIRWPIPKKAKFLYIMAVGGGGGGGAGHQAAIGVNRSGGSGGGGGAVGFMLIPTFFLKTHLLIVLGAGGPAVPGAAGTDGAMTTINNVAGELSLAQGPQLFRVLGGSGGLLGTTGSPAGGAGGIVTTDFDIRGFQRLAFFYYTPGMNGAQATPGAGGDRDPYVSNQGATFVTGGASGGGSPVANTNNAGGSITELRYGDESFLVPSIAGGAALSNGSSGFMNFMKNVAIPLYSLGGGGGGSGGAAAQVAGNGGNGGPGAGGGGGGGGVTRGQGGNGGDGFCLITWW